MSKFGKIHSRVQHGATPNILNLERRSELALANADVALDRAREAYQKGDDTGFKAQNDAVSLANVGTALGIGGGVLVGAGVVLFLTAPKDVVVTPTATASSGGISVVGRF